MRKYIVLYRAPITAVERFAQVSPEEAQQGMQLWFDWKEKLGSSLVDLGMQLGNAVNVAQSGVRKVDSDIVGMSILQANSIDEALELVKNHHHLRWAKGAEITLLEEMPIPELQG
ncbi:MAG: hypothetical protein GC179_20305 [Anaerolineaceae bacterium]|nr:hypothetical protein [Anaerolineaceae bacterium]